MLIGLLRLANFYKTCQCHFSDKASCPCKNIFKKFYIIYFINNSMILLNKFKVFLGLDRLFK